MRCKKHAADGSSSLGVCASCLRERLFAVMEAQAQRQAERHHQPPPVSFPRSVSPYISRRKSDTAAAATWRINGNHDQLFYSTPQVGPTGSLTVEIRNGNRKSRGGRFSSLFSGLFRSKSDKIDLDSGRESGDSCTASPSWFSTIISGGRKKQIRAFSGDENTIGARRKSCRIRDRGMSPARGSDDEDDEHFRGRSSGYSSESSQGWRRRTPTAARRGGGHCKNVSGLTFCLSPLVRPSPNRPWNLKGLPPEMAVGGDSRVPAKPHLSTTASFCKNRSRKLADFGRYSYNTNR